MKAKAILLLLLVLGVNQVLPGRGLEWSVSYGRWSSFPFTTLIENQCKKMIDYELKKLLGWASPLITLRTDQQSIDFSSSGYAIHAALKYNLPGSRLAVSLEASWLHLDLPYDLEFRQSVEIIGIPIAQAHTVGNGRAHIRSLDASGWLHWRVWQRKKVACSLAAGLHVMPWQGDVSLQGRASLKTIAGDSELDLQEQQTMTELRDEGLIIPRALVFPALAFSVRYMIYPNFGMQTRLALSQGVFLSLGFMLSL